MLRSWGAHTFNFDSTQSKDSIRGKGYGGKEMQCNRETERVGDNRRIFAEAVFVAFDLVTGGVGAIAALRSGLSLARSPRWQLGRNIASSILVWIFQAIEASLR